MAITSGCVIKIDVKCYMLHFSSARQIILIWKAAKENRKVFMDYSSLAFCCLWVDCNLNSLTIGNRIRLHKE